MSPALVQRQLALAGVALVSGLGTLAFSRGEAVGPGPETERPPVAAGRWYVAGRLVRAGILRQDDAVRHRAHAPNSRNLAHRPPVRRKVVVSYRGKEVPTAVVDRGAYAPGHEFELTQALASELGIDGPTTVRWRFAGEALK